MEENILPAAPVLQVKERTTGMEESGGGRLHEAAVEAGAHLPGHDPRIKGTNQHCAPRSCTCRDGEDTEPPRRWQGKQAHPPSRFVLRAPWDPSRSVLSCSSGHPLSPGPHLVGGPAPPWQDPGLIAASSDSPAFLLLTSRGPRVSHTLK